MIQFGVHADDGSPNFACLSFSLRFAGAVSEPVSYKCSTPVPGAGCCVVAENAAVPRRGSLVKTRASASAEHVGGGNRDAKDNREYAGEATACDAT